jgi:transcription elongation factor GreA
MSEMNKRVEVSSEGMSKLEERLNYLKGARRADVAEKLNIARGYGDLSENAEYDAAKNEQAALEAEIMELEATIRNAVVVDNTDTSTDAVGIGCTVSVHYVEDGDDDTYTITSALESAPMQGRISVESPVGKALLGHAVGETVTVVLPDDSEFHITIQDISREG